MTWKTLFVHQALLTALALINLVSGKHTWTGTAMNGYVSIALPFFGYVTGILAAGLMAEDYPLFSTRDAQSSVVRH